MIEYQAFLGALTSPPGKQLVGRTPICPFGLLFFLASVTPGRVFDNLPFVKPFLLGIALQAPVLNNEPHPVQESH